jgi:pimeloyl-ACP methyl ester carboxylesterase
MKAGVDPVARTKEARVMWLVIAVLLISVLALLGVLLFLSPGTPKPFLDGRGQPLAGSISEKVHLNNVLSRSLLHRECTLGERIKLWRGKLFSGSRWWNTQLSTDLTENVSLLDIPVYFLHGVYDYTVSYPLAKSYFELLDAPVKGFYTFKQSAHTPFFEEPEKMCEIMRADVLTGSISLADAASAP